MTWRRVGSTFVGSNKDQLISLKLQAPIIFLTFVVGVIPSKMFINHRRKNVNTSYARYSKNISGFSSEGEGNGLSDIVLDAKLNRERRRRAGPGVERTNSLLLTPSAL